MEQNLSKSLKKLIEVLRPNLLHHMRLSLIGKVVKVYEDEYRVDVIIGEDPDTLSLPEIPVNSIFAQDGYGVWALPEIDAEVSVSFYEGDVTRPYVEAPIFYNNQAPKGFKTGTLAMVGKHGQKLVFSPDKSEISIIADSFKTVTTGKKQSVNIGDEFSEIAGNSIKHIYGNQNEQIDGFLEKRSKNQSLKISNKSDEEYGNRNVKIKGFSNKKIIGNYDFSVGGNFADKVLGSRQNAVVGAKQEIVGGSYSMVIANGTLPQPNAYSINATTGNISINTKAGLIQLGGNTAISPAVLGTELVAHLSSLIQIFIINAPALTANVAPGAPAQLSPIIITALEGWLTGLAGILSQCVMIKKLPVG